MIFCLPQEKTVIGLTAAASSALDERAWPDHQDQLSVVFCSLEDNLSLPFMGQDRHKALNMWPLLADLAGVPMEAGQP
jgi:hypothetical protein